MVGMGFVEFLILVIISVVISIILFFIPNFPVEKGCLEFLVMVIFGWLGAWLGSPVLGHWFEPLSYNNVYIIPAILGSLAAIILFAYCRKQCRNLHGKQE